MPPKEPENLPADLQEAVDAGALKVTISRAGVLWHRLLAWDMNALNALPEDLRSRIDLIYDKHSRRRDPEAVVEEWLNRWQEEARNAIMEAGLPGWAGRWRPGLDDGWEREPDGVEALFQKDPDRPFKDVYDLAKEREGSAASVPAIALRVLDRISDVRSLAPVGDTIDRYAVFDFAADLLHLASHMVPHFELAIGGLAKQATLGGKVVEERRRGARRANEERSGWHEYAFRLMAAQRLAAPAMPEKELIGWVTDCVNERQRDLGLKIIGDSAVRQATRRKRALYDQCLADAKAAEAGQTE